MNTSMARASPAAVLLLPLLLVLSAGCGAPEFVPDGPFNRPLKEFDRIEVRSLVLDLPECLEPGDRDTWSQAFSREFRKALYQRLYRSSVLIAPDGPLLVLEGRAVKYEWAVSGDAGQRTEQTTGTVEVQFTFLDESGARIGGGRISATQTGSSPRQAMERAEKRLVAGIAKYIRKSMTRKPEAEPVEPPEVTP